ncbi:MAG: hypothetical protein QW570_08025 [Candidatus Caldarchaeum sp.]
MRVQLGVSTVGLNSVVTVFWSVGPIVTGLKVPQAGVALKL